MRGFVRAGGVGLVAALRAPWFLDHRLPALLEPAPDCTRPDRSGPIRSAKGPGPGEESERAVRVGLWVLRALGRMPGPWRNTCLYRSAVACLALRSYGVSARLRLAVRSAEPESARRGTRVRAHAWVEPGPSDGPAGDWYELRAG